MCAKVYIIPLLVNEKKCVYLFRFSWHCCFILYFTVSSFSSLQSVVYKLLCLNRILHYNWVFFLCIYSHILANIVVLYVFIWINFHFFKDYNFISENVIFLLMLQKKNSTCVCRVVENEFICESSKRYIVFI